MGLFEGPRGVAPVVWEGAVIRNLSESLFLRDGSKAMLATLMTQCRAARPHEPLAIDALYQALMENRFRYARGGREVTFHETLKNRFERLLTSPVFACSRGFDVEELVAENALIRCAGMPDDEFVLVVNDLLLRLALVMPPRASAAVTVVLVLEELHRLTNKERRQRADIVEPIVYDAFRTLAKRGVMLVGVDQVPSELPVQIHANAATRLVFATIEGRDLDAIQRSLSLTLEQRTAIARLPRQVACVQYANPAHPEPFLVRVMNCDVAAPSAEAIAARACESARSLSWEPLRAPAPARPKAETEAPRETADRAAGVARTKRASGSTAAAHPMIVSKPALDYLVEVAKDPFLPATRRDEAIGTTGGQGHALRTELVDAGLVTLERFNTHGRSKTITNVVPTEAGYTLLQQMRVRATRPRGKGGWAHVWHQHAVARWARAQGWTARVEHMDGGKAVDVALDGDGRRIAVEVLCEGVPKELANLADLEAGYDEIWFGTRSPTDAKALQRLVKTRLGAGADAVLARVRFRQLREFQ